VLLDEADQHEIVYKEYVRTILKQHNQNSQIKAFRIAGINIWRNVRSDWCGQLSMVRHSKDCAINKLLIAKHIASVE
jgi:hypothetical protein